DKCGMNRPEDAHLLHLEQRLCRVGLLQQEFNFVTYPLACDAAQHRQGRRDVFKGTLLNLEIQAMRKAECAENACRIIHETQAVQHTNQTILQIGKATVEVEDSAFDCCW